MLQQELGTVTPDDFRVAINQEILPRLMISYGKGIGRTLTYNSVFGKRYGIPRYLQGTF